MHVYNWHDTLTTMLASDTGLGAIGCWMSVRSISKSATLDTLTSASGLVLGASNNARRVGSTAWAISSWLHLMQQQAINSTLAPSLSHYLHSKANQPILTNTIHTRKLNPSRSLKEQNSFSAMLSVSTDFSMPTGSAILVVTKCQDN